MGLLSCIYGQISGLTMDKFMVLSTVVHIAFMINKYFCLLSMDKFLVIINQMASVCCGFAWPINSIATILRPSFTGW